MTPLAPGRFSTTNAPLSWVLKPCAIKRAAISVGPPAPNGTIIRTVRDGYCCAQETDHKLEQGKARTPLSNASKVARLTRVLLGVVSGGRFRCNRLYQSCGHVWSPAFAPGSPSTSCAHFRRGGSLTRPPTRERGG